MENIFQADGVLIHSIVYRLIQARVYKSAQNPQPIPKWVFFGERWTSQEPHTMKKIIDNISHSNKHRVFQIARCPRLVISINQPT